MPEILRDAIPKAKRCEEPLVGLPEELSLGEFLEMLVEALEPEQHSEV
jgi:hypothetical protein